MATLQVIDSRERDLGGFVVRRILPSPAAEMVGPFIFFDHLGPAQFAPGAGIDVRPHPHIALATVTYLFAGALRHRDSLGTVRDISPGDVNWMTAGQGIAHSERTPPAERSAGQAIHGIQSWVALPDGAEEAPPAFAHHPAASLPRQALAGVDVTVIAGDFFGQRSPVATLWPTLYVDARFAHGAELELRDDTDERAVYVVQGDLCIDGAKLREGQLALIEPGTTPKLRAIGDTRVMLLGGKKFPTPRHIWWNFVASSQEKIEAAKQRWQRKEFPSVPGETEYIPLPTG